ncbi:seryl-tRNA synthetase [Mycoplasmopsis californica]|uniref:Serine--tRNA ligase n=1 Tax=Mycoplasmopsis equigenitalium TaxID=114883 RepID=A0ABY5J2W5_9BACT|nr:serine--tRNA ligase [Mycoplasmopsis equigenitalium]UUD37074.1 serine--tRNA ligase [Mycoplasmopsis equigenitalium]VEU69625.1 seryl-tRNA synthetase [Mycoplasmopsis californica]
MLDIKFVIEQQKYVKEKLNQRGFDATIIDELVTKAKDLGQIMFKNQEMQAQIKKLSAEIGKNKNDKKAIEKLKNEITKIKDTLQKLKKNEEKLNDFVKFNLDRIPNIPLAEVPIGADENANVVIAEHSKLGKGLVNQPVSHDTLGAEFELFDLPRAVKLSGSRFVLFKKDGAKLIRALQNFMLDEHIARGYVEYNTPVLVKENIMYGTGQLPKFEEDLFKLTNNLYLISTAEVSLTNIYNNEIIDLTKPIKLTAFTECFRSEAGSGGKDTKGIIRNHQFKKVELVKIAKEEDAPNEFNLLLADAKNILEKLELPFREVMLCTGDLGFSSQKTIDLEVWMPSEFKYREISSVSTFGDFQGRRAMIRYKDLDGKNKYAFTINGSGLAIDRLIAAIIENNYDAKTNSITIPKALWTYFGKKSITK